VSADDGRLAPPAIPADRAPDEVAELATRWSDEDLQGVLNNAVVPTLLEEARLAWCRRHGLMDGASFPFVLLQTNVRFVAPGRGGEAVRVELWNVSVGERSLRQAYRVRASDGEVWCEAEALLVGWDGATRSSRPLPDALRSAAGA
jgi:acyl-CoA thioesterase FadM